jgi:type IV secretory pathway VirB3-like protein
MNSKIPHQSNQYLIIMIDFAVNFTHSTSFASLLIRYCNKICNNNVGMLALRIEKCLFPCLAVFVLLSVVLVTYSNDLRICPLLLTVPSTALRFGGERAWGANHSVNLISLRSCATT